MSNYYFVANLVASLVDNKHDPVNILDIGAGNGQLLYDIRSFLPNATLTGIDLYKDSFYYSESQVSSFFQLASKYSVNLVNVLPYQDSDLLFSSRNVKFDIIVCNQVVEHVADLKLFLERLESVMSPAGLILIGFPVFETLVEPHIRFPFIHMFRGIPIVVKLLLCINLLLGPFAGGSAKRLPFSHWSNYINDHIFYYYNFLFLRPYFEYHQLFSNLFGSFSDISYLYSCRSRSGNKIPDLLKTFIMLLPGIRFKNFVSRSIFGCYFLISKSSHVLPKSNILRS